MLEALGVCDVVSTDEPSIARLASKRTSFDVLLCSFRLGVEHDLLRATREASPRTRAILISAYAPASKLLAKSLGDAEVLESPFTVSALELALRRALGHKRGLHGEVQELSLVDILQMYHHGRQSIAISLSGPISGRVCLSKGEIVHAESDRALGQAALSRLLGAETGTISTELSPPDHERTIQGSFHSLVLGALTEHDEHRRTLAPPSPQDLAATPSSFAAGAPPLGSTSHQFQAVTMPDSLRPPLSSIGLGLWRRQRPRLLVAALAVLVACGLYFAFGSKGPDAERRLDRATASGVGSLAPGEPASSVAAKGEANPGAVPLPSAGAGAMPLPSSGAASASAKAPAAAAPAPSAAAPSAAAPSAPARIPQPAAGAPRPAPPARQAPAGARSSASDGDDFDIRPER